ncbi:probable basic-leucine zipper transcription factor R [Drosophila navojoa]|uniref:probable basic-leucine zipper transcription factor R n=1 Tax=Drosophila navojoa TaxID=7232 RepID=UPI0011BE5030|nr:probable basic-leucine zipper transcription factor R [Drosophila navojoa]
MSLPAPPSTEEIKEFNDFTLMESNQLDSLPPPPPPLSEPAIGNGHQHDEDAEQEEQEEQEEQQQKELQEQEPKQQLKLANGKICAPPNTAEHTNGTGTGQEQPSTLTPPASPPASPSAATLCAGSLANGIHAVPQPMVVDVNGS